MWQQRKHVAGLIVSLMFFQVLALAGTVVSWYFIMYWTNRDLSRTYPGESPLWGQRRR
jgi:hypothetical protein